MSERRGLVVLGGGGRFGRLIAQRLAADDRFEVTIAGRDAARAEHAARSCGAASWQVDARDPRLASCLRERGTWLVVDAAGPFQGRDYSVARACIAAGAHLVDIADGRDYVGGIAALDPAAREAGVGIVSGASSVPALTGAVVAQLARGLRSVDEIDMGITTSGRAPGGATVEAILGYAGRPVPGWAGGRACEVTGWGRARRRRIAGLGERRFSDCDVPDLALLPPRYPGVSRVRFGAGSESAVLHGALRLWSLAVAAGWPSRWRPPGATMAAAWNRIAPSSGRSALFVEVRGKREDGARTCRTWTLVAHGEDGANIPALPAVALARRLATRVPAGARPCLGLLVLDEIVAEMEGLRLAISETEVAA